MKKNRNKNIKLFLVMLIFGITITACQSNKQPVEQKITIIPGTEIVTYGFADTGKMKYGNDNFVLIDDKTYPDMNKKVEAFRTAVSGNNFVIIDGDIDLSCGIITDMNHDYFDEFKAFGTQTRN